jgi:hypothetical protein
LLLLANTAEIFLSTWPKLNLVFHAVAPSTILISSGVSS